MTPPDALSPDEVARFAFRADFEDPANLYYEVQP
jgi:hypothetical protein